MIESLAKAAHRDRENALRSDPCVAIVIHESGHALMGHIYGIHRPISLPERRMWTGAPKFVEFAEVTFRGASHLSKEALTDFCFGGYCGELAFYDDEIVRTASARYFVNADRAANDMIYFLKYAPDIPNAESAWERLHDKRERRSIVRELYKRHGEETYKKMLQRRPQLIGMAQEVYEFWKVNNFQHCSWSHDARA